MTAPRSRRAALAVAAAFVAVEALALVLRAWGIDLASGQPRGRPDESELVLGALKLFDGSLDAGEQARGWPDGVFLIQYALLRLQAAALTLRYGTAPNLGCLFAIDPASLLLAARAGSVVLGVLTLWPAGRIAARLVPAPRATAAALVAELLLAVNYLHGRDSRFAVTDAAVTFFVTWAMAESLRFVEDPRPRVAFGAGLAGGLAVACKWFGLFVLPVIAAVVLTAARAPSRAAREAAREVNGSSAPPVPSRWRRLLPVAAAAGGVLLGFAVLAPRTLLKPAAALAGLLDHRMRYAAGAWHPVLVPASEPGDLGLGLFFHARVTLPAALGVVGLAAAIAGIVFALRARRGPALAALLGVALLFGVAVGPTRVLFVRYCIPVLPLLVAFAAAGVVGTADWIAPRLGRAGRAALPVACLAAALPPAIRLATVDRILARSDTRALAQAWLVAHAPPGATVFARGVLARPHAVESGALAACNAALPPSLRRALPTLPGARVDWAGLVALGPSRYRAVAAYATYSDAYFAPDAPGLAARPDFVVDTHALVACGRAVPGDLVAPPPLDGRCFREVARFTPGAPACDAEFDRFDAFYLPFTGFSGVERLGPEVVIYRNGCR